MADLSPQAQAVYDAHQSTSVRPVVAAQIAAALRAAVEQCRYADRTGLPYITPADLLAIAHELEQAP